MGRDIRPGSDMGDPGGPHARCRCLYWAHAPGRRCDPVFGDDMALLTTSTEAAGTATGAAVGTGEAPPLEVHDLTVAYHSRPVLWGIDLVVPKGKLVGIIGPNGAGKSTLIKACMGVVPVASGWVKIFGQPLSKAHRSVGYVPQRESVDWGFPVKVVDA